MSFNDLEQATIKRALDGFLAHRRPPVHIRFLDLVGKDKSGCFFG
jgi:hypothetical protein